MVQADKKAPESPSNSVRIKDFSGGLNSTISGSLLNPNEAQKAVNTSFEQKGTLVPLRGRRKRYAAAFTSEPVSGLGALYKHDGTSRIVVASGTEMFSDKPNMVNKWDSKSDFENDGIVKTKFIDLATDPGYLELRHNYVSRNMSACGDASLFMASDVALVVDNATVKYGTSSIKMTINASKTVGKMTFVPALVSGTDYAVGAYLYNGNAATGMRLVAIKTDGTVLKGSAYTTGAAWTKHTLKISDTELSSIMSVGVEISGAATQYGYVDGIIITKINQADYDNASYVAPDFTDFEPLTVAIDVRYQNQWNDGEKSDIAVVGDSITCGIGSGLTSGVSFPACTLSGAELIGTDLTIDTNITWEAYSYMTFDALILV